MVYSLGLVKKIMISDRNQRFIWSIYNFNTKSLTSSEYQSIASTRKNLESFPEIFGTEIKQLQALEDRLKSRIDDSAIDDVPF